MLLHQSRTQTNWLFLFRLPDFQTYTDFSSLNGTLSTSSRLLLGENCLSMKHFIRKCYQTPNKWNLSRLGILRTVNHVQLIPHIECIISSHLTDFGHLHFNTTSSVYLCNGFRFKCCNAEKLFYHHSLLSTHAIAVCLKYEFTGNISEVENMDCVRYNIAFHILPKYFEN